MNKNIIYRIKQYLFTCTLHYNHRYCNTLKKARIYALTNLYEEINTDFDKNYTLPFYLLSTIETTKTLHIYLMTLKVAFHCNAYNNRTLLGTRGLVNIQYLNYCWEQQKGWLMSNIPIIAGNNREVWLMSNIQIIVTLCVVLVSLYYVV